MPDFASISSVVLRTDWDRRGSEEVGEDGGKRWRGRSAEHWQLQGCRKGIEEVVTIELMPVKLPYMLRRLLNEMGNTAARGSILLMGEHLSIGWMY